MARFLFALVFAVLFAGCSFLGGGDITIDRDLIVLDGNSTAVITIRNPGAASVDWELTDDALWLDSWLLPASTQLRSTPTRGTLGPFGSARILLVVDRAYRPLSESLAMERNPGAYAATVTVGSVQGDLHADVRFIVDDEPTGDLCQAVENGRSASNVDTATSTGAVPIGATDTSNHVESHVYGVASSVVNAAPTRLTHVLVRYREPPMTPAGAGAAMVADVAEEVARSFALTERRPGPGRGVELVRIPEGVEPEAFARRLAQDPRVLHAEVDRPLYLQRTVPNDPALGRQWGPCRFGLPSAWDVSTGATLGGTDAAKTTIAIIDSGVDIDHPDLAAHMLAGYDFCPVSRASSPSECRNAEPGGQAGSDTHGTHVAGIAAAAGDNGTGIAGVAFGGARILPVKVFDDAGSVTSVGAVACGIYWAIGSTNPDEICGATPNPHPARILNLSLGGAGSSTILDDAIRAATGRGALVFAASGNGSSSTAHQGVLMPANAPDAVAVGAVNSNFERSSFSHFDVLGGPSVDLMAPGGFLIADGASIYSTFLGDTYGSLGGTSMATPFAAGVAALVWSRNPSMTAGQVLERLRSSAYAAPTWDPVEYGAGVICADRALGLATQCGTN